MRKQEDDMTSYAALFVTLSSSVEKWLKRLIIVLFLSLILSQVLLQFTAIRYHLTTIGRLEGMTDEPIYSE